MSNIFFSPENYVRRAVAIGGGPTRVSNLLSISNATVHSWAKNGRVPNLDYAKKLSDLSGIKVSLLRPVL